MAKNMMVQYAYVPEQFVEQAIERMEEDVNKNAWGWAIDREPSVRMLPGGMAVVAVWLRYINKRG